MGGSVLLPGALACATALAGGQAWRYRRLYQVAQSARRNYAELVENLSEGIYRSSPDGRQLSANQALVKLNGYASEAEMLQGVKDIGREWYVEPTRRREFRALLHRDGRVDDFVSEIYRHKTRERIWITESARLVRHRRTGKVLFYEGSVREITDTVNRLNLEERFQKLSQEVPGALFQFEFSRNAPPRVSYLSPGIARLTGYSQAAHIAEPMLFAKLVLPEDRSRYEATLAQAARKGSPWEVEFRLKGADGVERWLRLTASPERVENGITWHGYVADVTQGKRHELAIEELAYFDTLTKLPNRRLFFKRMAESIGERPGRPSFGALLFVDLDNFKTLNDTQGHDVGDAYLVQVAERLKACVEDGDTVARIGGDEFVAILGARHPNSAHASRHGITVGSRIAAALRGEFKMGPVSHMSSASVGVVVFDRTERQADDILKRADVAMYQAKAAGRNGVALFDPQAMDREKARYQMLHDLRSAASSGQLRLHFQPQFDHERRIVGAEALVRWQHPTFGMVLPSQFIPLADQFGLNTELCPAILEQALAALARWQRRPTLSQLRLSINIGVQCFANEQFIPMVKEAIDRHEIDPTMVTFELTEHVMARNHAQVASRMREVKRLGLRLSLDDFGSGYSSLALLRRLPLDEIKIDGAFVTDIEESDEDRALVRTILAMSRTLKLRAVAEHVETVQQEAFLRAFGCDAFQGFLYSPAMREDEFLDFVLAHRTATPEPRFEARQQA
jgi:diguanylate cyclase (GGDEF)-like protein/PAS domain S-box-containing protein